ncbi:MAG: DUF177 domain-containing protein [Aquihabitans sp.]
MTQPVAARHEDQPQQPRLVVSVTEIRRRLGSRMPIQRHMEAFGLTLSDAGVPDGADVSFQGEAESISNGVVLTGVVTTPWVGICRRCLGPVQGVATVDIREIYEARPTDGETWPLENDHIDIGPLLHDTALLAMPLAPLCGDNCLGPAPEAYPAALGPDDDDEVDKPSEPPRDPRWAALDNLDLSP